jgi:hypothetical protein
VPAGDRDEFNLQEAFEYARSAIQTLIAVNGAAAGAIIAFYGQALSANKATIAAKGLLADALTAFALGVISATLTLFLAYFTQRLWGANHSTEGAAAAGERAANICNAVALALALGSLIAFALGCLSAKSALML